MHRVARCLTLDVLAAEVVAALESAGIESILLKGPATVRRLYLEDPSERLYTDVDLLVAPGTFAAASDVLVGLGFHAESAGLGVVVPEAVYEQAWTRGAVERVDLHRGFHHVPDAQAFWEALRMRRVPLVVAGVQMHSPDEVAGALIYALHACNNGDGRQWSGKPLEDLRRALARFGTETWAEAAVVAGQVGGLDAFAMGLRLLPCGESVAQALGLPTAARPLVVMTASGSPHQGDKTLALFLASTSWSHRLHILRRVVLPSRKALTARWPVAEQGRVGFTVAYLLRLGSISVGVPVSWRHWRASVRSAKRSGWSSPKRGVRRRVTQVVQMARDPNSRRLIWWTVRAVRASRAQLLERQPPEVRLPPLPSGGDPAGGDRTVRLAARAARASCLETAIVRQRFLASQGVRRDLVIGVTAPSAGFRAHAWLEGDGGTSGFVELHRHPAPSVAPPRLPDFVVIGAPKAGSTTLWGYLRAHPEVFMCTPKEPQFFNDDDHWERGVDWYRELFADAGDAKVVGEASVRYATSQASSALVPSRMAAVLPEAKIVYVVRHPVERMVSQWRHNRRWYAEPLPLQDALRTPRYLMPSRYAAQLARFSHYPAERVHIVVAERMRDDPAAELRLLFTFLGVDPDIELQGVEPEQNRAADQRVPRWWMQRAMRNRGVRLARRLVRSVLPQRTQRGISRITRRRDLDDRSGVPDGLEALFADDVARLRAYVAGPFDGWGIG